MKSKNRNHHGNKKGQGLVEFALVLLVLLMLAFGVLDLARVFHNTIVITGAAREGTRFLTRNPDDLDGARNAALNEAQNAGIALDISNIAANCGTCDSGQTASVSVTHTFATVLGNLFAASPLEITRSAQMMVP